MESFFSSLKTERRAHGQEGVPVYQSRADVFNYIERLYNPTRRQLKLGWSVRLSSRSLGRCPRNRQQPMAQVSSIEPANMLASSDTVGPPADSTSTNTARLTSAS